MHYPFIYGYKRATVLIIYFYFCQTCSGRCHELKECVQCQAYGTGQLDKEECALNCTHFTPVLVEIVDGNIYFIFCLQ